MLSHTDRTMPAAEGNTVKPLPAAHPGYLNFTPFKGCMLSLLVALYPAKNVATAHLGPLPSYYLDKFPP